MDLAVDVYRLTQRFPKEETYGLRSQLRRAAVSVPSNIAEGNGQSTRASYIRFLVMARGSMSELQTQMEISSRLEFIAREDAQDFQQESEAVYRMLNKLISKLGEGHSGMVGEEQADYLPAFGEDPESQVPSPESP
jgi:four helix bundle protein